jgi:hypothetical protein
MGELFVGDSLHGKASILNSKSTLSTYAERDNWARSIQASIPLSEYELETSSVTSSSNWIKAFRTQSHGQEVTIPCVKSLLDGEEDHDERVERMLPSSTPLRGSTTTSAQRTTLNLKSKHLAQKIHSKDLSQKNPAAPPVAAPDSRDLHVSEDEILSATSVRLVQDYIDLSSAILNPKTYRHITSVTKSDLRPPPSAAKDSRPLKSHYSGMDKDDDISLIAPKYQPSQSSATATTDPLLLLPHNQASAPNSFHDSAAPSLSIFSIQSPRSQTQSRPKRIPLELHDSSRSGVSASNSLVGIGGEILERDSVYLSAPQSSHPSSQGNANANANEIPVVIGSSFSPIKTTRKQLLPSQASPGPENPPGPAPSSPTRARGREIHMQLPIPCQSVDFTDSLITSPSSPPRQRGSDDEPPQPRQEESLVMPAARDSHRAPHSHRPSRDSPLLQNSSILTKFVTEDTQNILNQYLNDSAVTTTAKYFRPSTQQQRSNCTTLRPRAVTPSLEVSWNEELREQQKALRTVFQSKITGSGGGGRSKHRHQQQQPPQHSSMKPHIPPFRRSVHSAGPTHRFHVTAEAVHRDERSISLRARGLRSPEGRAPLQRQVGQQEQQGRHLYREQIDSDSVSEIQSVLNQMTRPEVACETIKPLEKYSSRREEEAEEGRGRSSTGREGGGSDGEGSVLTVEAILDQLDSIKLLDNVTATGAVVGEQSKREARSHSESSEGMVLGKTSPPAPVTPPSSLSSATPRLLLKSPRLPLPLPSSSAAPATQLPTQTRARISLPAVNGPGANGSAANSVAYADASPLNSLSVATVPSSPTPSPGTHTDKEACKTMSRRILRTHQSPAGTGAGAATGGGRGWSGRRGVR